MASTVTEKPEPTYVDAAVQRCPFSMYRETRDEHPVYKDPVTGTYNLTRYEDLRQVARDNARFSSLTFNCLERQWSDEARPEVEKIFAEAGWYPKDTLVAVDMPEHKLYRSLVDRVFTAKRIKEMEPYFQQIIDELIDEFINDGKTEFVSSFAIPLPVKIIADQLGVPRSEAFLMRKFSEDMVEISADGVWNPEREILFAKKTVEIGNFFRDKLAAARAEGRDCLITALADVDIDGRKLTVGELVTTCNILMFGGNDTTTSATGSAMKILCEQPELAEKLANDLNLIPGFIEEVLRTRSPLQVNPRIATEDVEVHGVEIPKGSMVMLRWGAGNIDPREYPTEDKIDLDRPNKTMHLAFGYGNHICIGNQLARGELRMAFTTLLSRMKNFRFSGAPEASFVYSQNLISHGVDRLDLRFDKA